MEVKANAKVNLTLDILGKREDGYHEVSMVMQEIPLCDTIQLKKADNISLTCNVPYIPCDSRNLVYKAAAAFFRYTDVKGGVKMHLEKTVPSGAGLGGGSGDAAAVVKALNQMYKTKLNHSQMASICAGLGADVPFFITGGTCLAEGIGEILTPLPALPKCYMVLAKPPFSINTKWAYQNLRLDKIERRPDTKTVLQALEAGDLCTVAENMENVFESVVAPRYPLIHIYKTIMVRNGALCSLMSGSGSTVFGLFDIRKKAQKCYERLRKKAEFVYLCEIH